MESPSTKRLGFQGIIEADFVPTPGESIRLPKLLGSAAACGRKGGGAWVLETLDGEV